MIVVDASVWIDYFNGRDTPETDALDAWLGQEIIIVGDITITGVLQGFRRDADFRRALTLLESLEFREMLGKRELAPPPMGVRARRVRVLSQEEEMSR